MAKITTIASKYANRLNAIRDQVSLQHQPISIQDTTRRIYAEADQICFGEHRKAAVTFDDSSILFIAAGQIHVPSGRAKRNLATRIEALPSAMLHQPSLIPGSDSYQLLYQICLAAMKPTQPHQKPKATLCFSPIPPP